MERKFKLATWNANGLAKHSQEVKAFIFSKDILLISKTYFINKSYLRSSEYTLYHTIHADDKVHCGTALTIRICIKHYETDKHLRDFSAGHKRRTQVAETVGSGCITISAVLNT